MKENNLEIIIISNDQPPYHLYDVTILAAMNGLVHEFRYLRSFIDIPNEVDESQWIKSLEKRVGVFVIREKSSGLLIPLRQFMIYDVQIRGEYVFLDLQMKDYVHYEQGTTKKTWTESEFIRTLSTKLKNVNIQNNPGQDLNKLVFSFDGMTGIDTGQNQFADWEVITSLLSDIKVFDKVPFYLISCVKEVQGKSEIKPTKLRSKKVGYKLIGGKSYSIEILHSFQTKNPPEYYYQISTIPTHISALVNKKIGDGSYLKLNFVINAQPQSRCNIETILAISQSDRDVENPILNNHLRDFEIPIEINLGGWRFVYLKILPWLALSLGIVFWFTAETMSKEGSFFSKIGLAKEYIRYIALFLISYAFQNWATFLGQFKIEK